MLIFSPIITFAETESTIPNWIKETANWWYQEKISDGEFISAIEFLVEQKIVNVPDIVDLRYHEKYKDWAKKEISKYKEHYEDTKKSYDDVAIQHDITKNKLEKLEIDYDELVNHYDTKESEYQNYYDDVEDYLYSQNISPKITIYNQTISWELYDSKENYYSWEMPIGSYEELVLDKYNYDHIEFYNDVTDETYQLIDYTKYVHEGFTNVIDEIYLNSDNDTDFIYEVWYITSQLTVYSYDIGDHPRYALETFSRGGGDCEDTSILIADMIRSSKYTRNWDIRLVYFDADNPAMPRTINHVAVYVESDSIATFVESTAKTREGANQWNNLTESISGWTIDV